MNPLTIRFHVLNGIFLFIEMSLFSGQYFGRRYMASHVRKVHHVEQVELPISIPLPGGFINPVLISPVGHLGATGIPEPPLPAISPVDDVSEPEAKRRKLDD